MLTHAVMGSLEHPVSSLSVEGLVESDGESFREHIRKKYYGSLRSFNLHPGGGSGGTILLFLSYLNLGILGNLSSAGGEGSVGGSGGGGGGRIHFHWSEIPTGDIYQPIATVNGSIHAR